ncbi:DsbA family protein [Haloarcula litorea]|uniref:DsbA family protein n=1 Tax=Haloarcula litorea TaxID=3032579 RepID=UPI0023E8A40E|nr:thioredoxin domain-containing protein [Halomicroarcula sp. GDY20]
MSSHSRRAFLTSGLAAVAATAGCLGGPSSDAGGSAVPTAEGQPLPAPVAGDPDADVTVAVFEDYACPHCATYSLQVYPEVAADFLADGLVRYEFHDLPIPVDATASWQAANAARSVQAQAGDEAYFTYSKRLFENQDGLGPDAYADLTDGLDAEGDEVRRAATGRIYDPTIEADRQAAMDRGIQATPTVLVDGESVEWSEVAYPPVRDAIEAARDG